VTSDGSLNTVSLRLRVTLAVVVVLSLMMILLGVAIDGIFAAQSNRNLDALLSSRATFARQLARTGVGPQALVNRVETNGVRAHLELRSGQLFGSEPPAGDRIRSTTVNLRAPGRGDGAVLTQTGDT
jgi:two-component system OmpR family sensor kinase